MESAGLQRQICATGWRPAKRGARWKGSTCVNWLDRARRRGPMCVPTRGVYCTSKGSSVGGLVAGTSRCQSSPRPSGRLKTEVIPVHAVILARAAPTVRRSLLSPRLSRPFSEQSPKHTAPPRRATTTSSTGSFQASLLRRSATESIRVQFER